MGKERLFRGGEFLITDALAEEVFTPEDFTKEQRLIGQAAEEFAVGEVALRRDELQELNPELVRSLLKKAGELGLLATDIPVSCPFLLNSIKATLESYAFSPTVKPPYNSYYSIFLIQKP